MTDDDKAPECRGGTFESQSATFDLEEWISCTPESSGTRAHRTRARSLSPRRRVQPRRIPRHRTGDRFPHGISGRRLTGQIVTEGSYPSEVAEDGASAPTLLVASARAVSFHPGVYSDKSSKDDAENYQ
jgi:hypothetical protein